MIAHRLPRDVVERLDGVLSSSQLDSEFRRVAIERMRANPASRDRVILRRLVESRRERWTG